MHQHVAQHACICRCMKLPCVTCQLRPVTRSRAATRSTPPPVRMLLGFAHFVLCKLQQRQAYCVTCRSQATVAIMQCILHGWVNQECHLQYHNTVTQYRTMPSAMQCDASTRERTIIRSVCISDRSMQRQQPWHSNARSLNPRSHNLF